MLWVKVFAFVWSIRLPMVICLEYFCCRLRVYDERSFRKRFVIKMRVMTLYDSRDEHYANAVGCKAKVKWVTFGVWGFTLLIIVSRCRFMVQIKFGLPTNKCSKENKLLSFTFVLTFQCVILNQFCIVLFKFILFVLSQLNFILFNTIKLTGSN